MTADEPWWPHERQERLIRLRSEGASYGKIAEAMGITRSAVAGQLRRLKGIVPPLSPRVLSDKPANIARRERRLRAKGSVPRPVPTLTVALPAHAPRHCQYVYGSPLRFCTNKRAVVAGRVSMYCEEHGIRIKPTARVPADAY